jgi:thermitase
LQVNGTTVAADSSAPFGFSWDSTGVANGMANLVAVAYDAAGNSASSSTISVSVANAAILVQRDTTPPVVAIANPVAGRVTGTVSVNLSASDNSGAAGITQQLFIDGVLKAKGSGATLAYSWNTRKSNNGTHSLKAVATDAAGNTSSASVQVTK